MTTTSTKTLRRRRLLAAALSLPLSLALTGTALASGSSAELRTAGAGADKAAAASKDSKADSKDDSKADSKADSTTTKTSTGSAAGAASGKSAATATRDSSSNPDKHGTATAAPLNSPQPLSKADRNGTGANPGNTCTHSYCSTRDGSASGNGVGDGNANGKPCAGCVGKADNKNPKGQAPDGSDHNAGYECDRNQGIGKTNPAHTGCKTTTTPTSPSPKPSPKPTQPATCPDGSAMPASGDKQDCKKDENKDVKTCPDGSAMPASGDKKDCKKDEPKDVKTCPNGSAMPASGDKKDCVNPGKGVSDNAKDKVTICHATGSATNPYVIITPSKQGVLNGHVGDDHQGGRDIIPSFTYVENGVTKTFPGQGDTSLIAKGCVTPGKATPVAPTCPLGMTMGPVAAGCIPTAGGGTPISGAPQNPASGPAPVVVGPPTVTPSGNSPETVVPNGKVTPVTLGSGTVAPAAAPAGAAAPAAAPRALPFTGTDAALLVTLGSLLLLAGSGVLVAARRERTARIA